MRKAIFIFIAIILVAASIDWIRSCNGLKSHKEVFGREITYADMFEYKDTDYDYVVRVPSFFTAQADSLQDNGQSLKDGMDSLAQVLQATDRRLGSDYFILSGPQCENGSRIEGYSYYSKVMANHKLWFVYTMIYPDNYEDVLTRLFKEIDDWQIWERPHLQLKQGESQTPKAVSE